MIKVILYPLSILYGLITEIRNKLFNIGWLKSTRFNVPVVCIGNITVGGTGKTPHTEYAIKLLEKTHNIAVLSRGYGRKTKGFYWVKQNLNAIEVGDEPLQIKTKFANIPVAVCENRVEGIKRILNENKLINLIILDDAFQHRAVNASTKILLIDYNRPLTTDYPFPAGRLREFAKQRKRADIIIYTKCPIEISEQERKNIELELKLKENQKLFFSHITYGKPINIDSKLELNINNLSSAIMLTGIAQPKALEEYLSKKIKIVDKLIFPDHHNYSKSDIKKISDNINKHKNSVIITTEKDASRLRNIEISDNIKTKIYYIPIEISFINGNKTFDNNLLQHVTNN